MIAMGISILWLALGIIVLLGCVWLALYVVSLFVPVPATVQKAVYAIALILIVIGALTLLSGGGTHFPVLR